jgi:hypothetical protein
MSSRGKDPGPYAEVIDKTAAMVRDRQAQALAQKHGLNILDVTWEDTGRYKGSAVGPNISDMTIQVQDRQVRTGEYRLTCMPVIRTPNFADISADVPVDSFYLQVGNEKGQPLRRVTLHEFLGNLRKYLTEPDSWAGEGSSLLAERDTHVLVSAQACFLPIPKEGKAEFNPVVFNYQSIPDDPAVLTILATREGTSVTVIDNQRDGFEAGRTWGQRLFFNDAGQRASLTGERISEFVTSVEAEGGDVSEEERRGLNLVLLIQVPLKQKNPPLAKGIGLALFSAMAATPVRAFGEESDVEEAVIGHGEVEGPFTEIDRLPIERDERFPVRVTVQFYKATSNGILSAQDITEIADQIDRVYQDADYVGSLVTEGETGRPTEHDGPKQEPPDWWEDFWNLHEQNTGQSREQAIEMLRRIRPHWQPTSQIELIEALQEIRRG